MLAAAALVKVMQRIFSGGTPSSRSRITRLTSTWVLPAPALAETNADNRGFERASAVARTAGVDARRLHGISSIVPCVADHSLIRARSS